LEGDTARESVPGHRFELHVSDWLPALLNAGRAVAAIVAVQMFWIWTEWPNGALAITFTAVTVILLSPRSEESYATAVKFTVGTTIAALGAATVLFAGLPNVV